MALTANREVDRYVDDELRSIPVNASTHVYKGALVGLTNGYARGLVATDKFAGIAYEEVDNSSGAAGDAMVRVYTSGDFEHALASASRANNGVAVYASDDGTLTLSSSGTSLVGNQVDAISSAKIILRLRPWMQT